MRVASEILVSSRNDSDTVMVDTLAYLAISRRLAGGFSGIRTASFTIKLDWELSRIPVVVCLEYWFTFRKSITLLLV